MCLDELFGDRLSYCERMSGGPDWCSWELCATEPARDRLRAWVDETPEPWQAMSEAEIRVALWGNFYGDELVRLIAAKVITQLPMPVADYTLKNVALPGRRSVGTRLGRSVTRPLRRQAAVARRARRMGGG